MRFVNKRKKEKQFFALKNPSNLLRNIIGQIFNATLDGFSTQQVC